MPRISIGINKLFICSNVVFKQRIQTIVKKKIVKIVKKKINKYIKQKN